MEDRKYCVYLITCLVNSKQYAGKTCQRLSKRWIKHRSDARKGRDLAFCRAIRKHGVENFVVSVLRENLSKHDANAEERLAIRTLNLLSRDFGYNMTEGGEDVRYMGKEAKERQLKNHRCRRKDISTEEVVRLYREGMNTFQLAKKFETTPQSIRGRLIKAKEPRRVVHLDFPTMEVVLMYRDGKSTEWIAAKIGVNPEAVRKRLIKAGEPRRSLSEAQKIRYTETNL